MTDHSFEGGAEPWIDDAEVVSIRRRGSIDPRLLFGVALRLLGLVMLAATLGAAITYFAG